MSAELATLAADPSRIEHVSPDELPALIGELEALKAACWARLVAPGTTNGSRATPEPSVVGDHLLTANEAAAQLGVSRRWMYRHADTLPFTRKLTSGTLRFSARGLERWKEKRR